MSPHGQEHVSSLVHDLVEMAEATRRLPELERELQSSRELMQEDGARIARLEQKLMDRANTIDELNSKLRSVEAERDDAGFRLLEAEDKVVATERALGDLQTTLGSLIQAIRKESKSTEVNTSAPSSAFASDGTLSPGESFVDEMLTVPTPQTQPGYETPVPTIVPSAASSSLIANGDSAVGQGDVADHSQQIDDPTMPADDFEVGQSETNPIASLEGVDTPIFAVSEASVSPPKPYADLFYADFPNWVSRRDWIEGGGTDETYDYRPPLYGRTI